MIKCMIPITFLLAVVAQGQDGAFRDKTVSSGIKASYGDTNLGFGALAGGAVGDFDRDGWQDVFYPAGNNGPDLIFINNGDGTFTEAGASWGIDMVHHSTAAVVGDYDGDGWLDIFVTSLGSGPGRVGKHVLYRNNGDRTFTNRAVAAGVNQTSATIPDGFGGAWGDYDLDGDLDLAVAGWLTKDGNRIFENLGDGTFADVTNSTGVGTALKFVHGLSPRFIDMDGDRYPELIWIGDFGSSLYLVNNTDGTFTDYTQASGTSLGHFEMGTTVADWDEDGDFDFYITSMQKNKLYLNQGGNKYRENAKNLGVEYTGWGWATVAFDFNLDSYVDIIATSQSNRQFAFVNRMGTSGKLHFEEVSNSIGLRSDTDGRGLANFDYDNDGDQDLIIFPHTGDVQLYRNEITGANWLRVFLDRGDSTSIAPDGIGSVVELDIGERTLYGRVDGGTNYLSQSEMSANFGLGGITMIDELRVRWTDGTTTVLKHVSANQTLTIHPNGSHRYCVGGENSTGFSGLLVGDGPLSIQQNEFVLRASLLPSDTFASFFFGFREANIPWRSGVLCIGGNLSRLGSAVPTSANGQVRHQIDFSSPPAAGSITQGSTVYFQLWYRDGMNQPNLTNGVIATFH